MDSSDTAGNQGREGFLNVRQDDAFKAAQPALKRLAEAKSDDVKEIAASQLELLSRFYDLSLSQARRSFRWALIASVVGFLFLLAAIVFLINEQSPNLATASLIGGAMIEFIAGVNFVLYGKTLSQLTLFQGRLENTQRFLLANSLCESLDGHVKHYTRARLIGALAGITGSDMIGDLLRDKKRQEEGYQYPTTDEQFIPPEGDNWDEVSAHPRPATPRS